MKDLKLHEFTNFIACRLAIFLFIAHLKCCLRGGSLQVLLLLLDLYRSLSMVYSLFMHVDRC